MCDGVEFVLNPAGKSLVCVLHEYAQHALRIQPRYIFQELGLSLPSVGLFISVIVFDNCLAAA